MKFNADLCFCLPLIVTVFQKQSGIIVCTNSPPDVALENFTVVPEPNSTVLLGWKVTPTDGHYCIRNYNIQIAGPNGSQWEEQIPGSQHSFHLTGLQLLPLEEYTYCVTANLLRGQIGLNLSYIEPHPPTNLSAVVQCKQGYEIQIDWQVKYS